MKEILKRVLRQESVEYIRTYYPKIRLLANTSERELQHIPFVGEAKTKKLKAIFDISKIFHEPDKNADNIKSPRDVVNLMKIMVTYEKKSACCILLYIKNKVLDQLRISKGSLNSFIIHPREGAR